MIVTIQFIKDHEKVVIKDATATGEGSDYFIVNIPGGQIKFNHKAILSIEVTR